jgi:hypothetical protein
VVVCWVVVVVVVGTLGLLRLDGVVWESKKMKAAGELVPFCH